MYNTTVYVGNLPVNCTGKIFRCFLFTKAVLETAAGHWMLFDQILKMTGQFHIVIRHNDQTCH